MILIYVRNNIILLISKSNGFEKKVKLLTGKKNAEKKLKQDYVNNNNKKGPRNHC